MFPTNGRSIHKGIPLTPTCGVHWSVRHPCRGFEFYRAPILPLKPKAIARNVPRTPWAKGPSAPATPSLQCICENLSQLPISMAPSLAVGTVAHFHSSPPLTFPLCPSSPPKAEAATSLTTLSASELLPLRRSSSHRTCYNIDDRWRTGSATPSTNPVPPNLLQRR